MVANKTKTAMKLNTDRVTSTLGEVKSGPVEGQHFVDDSPWSVLKKVR